MRKPSKDKSKDQAKRLSYYSLGIMRRNDLEISGLINNEIEKV